MKLKYINIASILPPMSFAIAYVDGDIPMSFTNSLDDILVDSDAEYKYAIHERIKDVLTLEVGERMPMFFNRDNSKDSTGIIKRIR